MKKVILASGGTGGHVFPAIALSFELRKNGYYTILITDLRGAKYVKKEFNEVVILPISRFGWKFLVFSPYLFFKCLFKSFGVKYIVSFGGYTSFFPILASVFSLKKFFIVQLDSIVTRLNRFFSSYASKVFYLFPKTSFDKFHPNFYLTGAPIRSGFEFSFIRHSTQDFVISVVGGSLGSNYWKDLLFRFIKELPLDIRKTLSFFIQTDEDISLFDSFEIKSVISQPFFDTRQIFKKSHLIITRCGANTLAEIASIGRPVFLVPWDQAIENHQFVNAQNLIELGGGIMGDSIDLFNFFNELYFNEAFFIKTCANMSTAFEISGKEKIVDLLFDI